MNSAHGKLIAVIAAATAALHVSLARAEHAVQAEWLVPWYRDTIYASQQVHRAELLVTVRTADEELGDVGLYAEVSGESRSKMQWRDLRNQLRYRTVEQENVLRVDANTLTNGVQNLRLLLFRRESRTLLAEAQTTVTKLSASALEVCPTRNGALLVNGVPVFVTGLIAGSFDDGGQAQALLAGVTTLVPCVRAGAASPGYSGHDPRDDPPFGVVPPLPASGVPPIERAPDPATATTPLIWAWHTGVDGENLPTPEQYRQFVKASPYRPLLAMANVAQTGAIHADIAALRPTPGTASAAADRPCHQRWTQAIAARAEAQEVVWAIVPGTPPPAAAASQDPEFMAWLAVAAGAKGVLFELGPTTDVGAGHPGLQQLTPLTRRFRTASGILAQGCTKPAAVECEGTILTRVLYHNYRWLVCVVNPRSQAASFVLRVPELANTARLRTLHDGQQVPLEPAVSAADPAVIAADLPPFQARVYTNLPISRP